MQRKGDDDYDGAKNQLIARGELKMVLQSISKELGLKICRTYNLGFVRKRRN